MLAHDPGSQLLEFSEGNDGMRDTLTEEQLEQLRSLGYVGQ